MIDLIEKIHELKDYENYDYDQAITDVEMLLNNYNIITAPKTIKLSEIVNKLQEVHTGKIFVERQYGLIKINISLLKNVFNIVCINSIETKNNTITWLNHNLFSQGVKWLYTLWIAGTIIEDDLKERD